MSTVVPVGVELVVVTIIWCLGSLVVGIHVVLITGWMVMSLCLMYVGNMFVIVWVCLVGVCLLVGASKWHGDVVPVLLSWYCVLISWHVGSCSRCMLTVSTCSP